MRSGSLPVFVCTLVVALLLATEAGAYPITINAGATTLRFRLDGVLRDGSTGPLTVDLSAATHTVSFGNSVSNAAGAAGFFRFVVGTTGQITNVVNWNNGPTAAATASGSVLTFNNATIAIDPGLYAGRHSLPNEGGSSKGPRTVTLVPDLLYVLSVNYGWTIPAAGGYPAAAGYFHFVVNAAGQVAHVLNALSDTPSAAAVGDGATLRFNNVDIIVDPGLYAGFWGVSTFGFSQYGLQTITLVPEIFYSANIGYGFDFAGATTTVSFVVDSVGAVGQVTRVINSLTGATSASAVGVGNRLLFHNATIQIEPGLYAGPYTVRANVPRTGPGAVVLIPDMPYTVDLGAAYDLAAGSSRFAFTLDSAGRIARVLRYPSGNPSAAATGDGGALNFNNAPIDVDPQLYTARYYVGAAAVSLYGRTTVVLVPDLLYRLRNGSSETSPTAASHCFFALDATGRVGQIVNAVTGGPSLAATPTSTGLALNNVQVFVDPGGFTAAYTLGAYSSDRGPVSHVLIPDLLTPLTASSQKGTFVPNLTGVTPPSLLLTISGVPYLFSLRVGQTPVPTAIDPSALLRGATNQALVISGSGFESGATVAFGGDGITVNSITYQGATALSANVSIDQTATPGPRDVTVTNPTGQSGTGSGLLTILAPQPPTVTAVAPNTLTQEDANQVLAVTGTHFEAGATVAVSGGGITVHGATIESDTRLSVTVSVAYATTPGPRNLTVTNPNGLSGAGSGLLTILAHAPTVTAVAPNTLIQGMSGQRLTIDGSHFAAGAGVTVGGGGITVLSVAVVNDRQLAVTVSVAPAATAGARTVVVTNPDGLSGSGAGLLTIRTPQQVLNALSAQVAAFLAAGEIRNAGIANSLQVSLDNAARKIGQNNEAARGMLESLLNKLDAYTRGGQITQPVREALAPQVRLLISLLP
ncbi:MAG: hypothetical protein HZA54_11665 [Planctomycetes bacterium]|nr:hypothetical protein [Planctomycetota bacterium]